MGIVKAWWRRQRPFLISGLVFFIARTIGRSLRIKVVGLEESEKLDCGAIYCGWHGRSFVPAMTFFGRGFWAIISHSRDGEMQTRIFTKLGFRVIRGSTGRGGERALIESIKVLRNKDRMAITPDGPRGPKGIVQPGVLMMAKKSGAALLPVGSAARPCKLMPTWDGYMVPWLFARATFVIGEPIFVPSNADEETIERLRLELQHQIEIKQAEAEAMLA